MAYPPLGYFPTAAGVHSGHGVEIPTLWSKQLAAKFYGKSVIPHITCGDYEGEIKNFGDNLIIRLTPDVAVAKYQIGKAIQYPQIAMNSVTLTIDQGYTWSYQQQDVTAQQSDMDFTPKWHEAAVEQVKQAIDLEYLAWLPSKVGVNCKGIAAGTSGDCNLGAASHPVSVKPSTAIDLVMRCGQVMDEMHVPREGNCRFIVIPPGMTRRLKTSELKDASTTGDSTSPIRNGFVGNIDNISIYDSTWLDWSTESTKRAYYIPFGWKKSVAYAQTFVKTETLRSQTTFGDLWRGLQIYGYQMVTPDYAGILYATMDLDT